MNGNAISTKAFAVDGGLYHIRYFTSPGISQSGYFIDVDTQFGHVEINLTFAYSSCKCIMFAQIQPNHLLKRILTDVTP
jgi:hypothetical protein